MALSLLKTKLYIPPVRSGLVQRTRLIEQMNDTTRPGCRLTLLSAPAGFGKTTLLADWILQTDRAVAWLSLDAGDNDPVRFWSYVISALQTVQPDIGQRALACLQSPEPPPTESILTGLVNEIAGTDSNWTLILDDYHVITEPAINDSFSFMLEHLPSQMHLVLASRADPPWPLARLRVRREIIELRTEDLRFTLEEASAFLNAVMGLDLSPQDIALLETRTEGWIAGLQLAALSMQGRDNVTGFVQTFSGSHRFVLDYLVEEVLGRQPDDIRAFLLHTSILDRLTPPLCNAILDGTLLDSQAILAKLEQNNLFLIPLDDERRWYRYHHLFADLLSSRLLDQDPDLVSTLHHRASEWFEKRDMIGQAISHALQANDLDQTERLIVRNALAMILHGELSTLIATLQQLPPETVRSRPWLSVGYAWTLVYTSQFDAANALLDDVEHVLAEHPPAEQTATRHLAGHISAVRSYKVYLEGNLEKAIDFAREALERLPDKDARSRAYIAADLVSMLGRAGYEDHTTAIEALSEAVATSLSTGDLPTAIFAHNRLAIMYSASGQLNKLLDTSKAAIQLSNEYEKQVGYRTPAIGRLYDLASSALYFQNDLTTAERYARESIELYLQTGQPLGIASGYATLTRILQARDERDAALAAIAQACQVAERVSPWFASFAAAWKALLDLEQGNLVAAFQWAKASGLRFDDDVNLNTYVKQIILARVLVAQGRSDSQPASSGAVLEQAILLSSRLVDLAESTAANRYLVESLIVHAVALQAQGRSDQALKSLSRALALAQPEGIVRLFINEGPPMETLVKSAMDRGVERDYASHLLAEMAKSPSLPGATPRRTPFSPLLDPLTERELDILRLLPTHLSSTEIARQLYVSKNTVRSHIGHIYDKLGVHSRDEAVLRARELSLL